MSLGGIIAGAVGGVANVAGRQAREQQAFDLEQEKARLAEERALRLEELKRLRGIENAKAEYSAVEAAAKEKIEKDHPYGLVSDNMAMQDRPMTDADISVIKRDIARGMGYGEAAKTYDADAKTAKEDKNRKEDKDYKVQRDAVTDARENRRLEGTEKDRDNDNRRAWSAEGRAQEAHKLTMEEKREKKADIDVLIQAERDARENPENESLQRHFANKEAEYKRRWGSASEGGRYQFLKETDPETGQERVVAGNNRTGQLEDPRRGNLPGQTQTTKVVARFKSQAEAEAAKAAGQIKTGDLVEIGGRRARTD